MKTSLRSRTNPSATSAAPRAAHDALDASPRVSLYLPARSTSARLPTYPPVSLPTSTSIVYLLPSVAEDAVSIFYIKTAVRRRPPSSTAHSTRVPRGGGLLWCPQTVICELTTWRVRPVSRPYLWKLPRGEISGNFHCVSPLQRLESPNPSANSIVRL